MRYRFWIALAFRTMELSDQKSELNKLLDTWKRRNPGFPEAIITSGAPLFWDASKQWICFADEAVRVKDKEGFIVRPECFYSIAGGMDEWFTQGIESGVYCMLVQPITDMGEG